MALRRGLRNWLLAKDSDPSVRLRVLRDLLDRPADDPEVVRAQREIGRKGWAAQILRGQHPSGQWVNPGSSAFELYRPKYVATNWRLLVLSDLGLTKKTPRVAKAARLFLDRFSRSGDLGGRSSKVCIAGNSAPPALSGWRGPRGGDPPSPAPKRCATGTEAGTGSPFPRPAKPRVTSSGGRSTPPPSRSRPGQADGSRRPRSRS